VQHHRGTPAPDARAQVPELPEALSSLILELLAKRPEQRPDAAATRVRLEQLLAQLPAGE
jgi:hypothetical protein